MNTYLSAIGFDVEKYEREILYYKLRTTARRNGKSYTQWLILIGGVLL